MQGRHPSDVYHQVLKCHQDGSDSMWYLTRQSTISTFVADFCSFFSASTVFFSFFSWSSLRGLGVTSSGVWGVHLTPILRGTRVFPIVCGRGLSFSYFAVLFYFFSWPPVEAACFCPRETFSHVCASAFPRGTLVGEDACWICCPISYQH